jgi:poly-gamma-glutamate capsule biosynthesis protein CapA/YwtB (metallophosphatase superfamily)
VLLNLDEAGMLTNFPGEILDTTLTHRVALFLFGAGRDEPTVHEAALRMLIASTPPQAQATAATQPAHAGAAPKTGFDCRCAPTSHRTTTRPRRSAQLSG